MTFEVIISEHRRPRYWHWSVYRGQVGLNSGIGSGDAISERRARMKAKRCIAKYVRQGDPVHVQYKVTA